MVDVNKRTLLELDLDWARQSIAWAFSLRADELGSNADPTRWAELAKAEVNATTSELLAATFDELGEYGTSAGASTLFARKVMDWCDRHRHPILA